MLSETSERKTDTEARMEFSRMECSRMEFCNKAEAATVLCLENLKNIYRRRTTKRNKLPQTISGWNRMLVQELLQQRGRIDFLLLLLLRCSSKNRSSASGAKAGASSSYKPPNSVYCVKRNAENFCSNQKLKDLESEELELPSDT